MATPNNPMVAVLALVLGLGPAPLLADGGVVRIGVPPWQGAEVKTAVVAEILERAGYAVETTSAAAPLIFNEIAAGRLDANLSAWVPGQDEAFMPLVERGEIVIAGDNLDGAETGLAVPEAVFAEGIRSIADLADHAGRFERTIHCIEPGSGANRVAGQAVERGLYGLGDWQVLPSSTQAMLAELERSIRRQQAIVFCAWRPHWMNVAYEIRYLADPLEHWGGAGRTRVHTLVRPGLAQARPELMRFFERFRVEAATQSRWIHEYARAGREPEAIARDWVDAHAERVAGWIDIEAR
jgi:glycine betaine/proline transport system substrate-binding protein